MKLAALGWFSFAAIASARPANNKPITSSENLAPIHKATFTECTTSWDAPCIAALRAHVTRTDVTGVSKARNPIVYLQDLEDLEDNENEAENETNVNSGSRLEWLADDHGSSLGSEVEEKLSAEEQQYLLVFSKTGHLNETNPICSVNNITPLKCEKRVGACNTWKVVKHRILWLMKNGCLPEAHSFIHARDSTTEQPLLHTTKRFPILEKGLNETSKGKIHAPTVVCLVVEKAAFEECQKDALATNIKITPGQAPQNCLLFSWLYCEHGCQIVLHGADHDYKHSKLPMAELAPLIEEDVNDYASYPRDTLDDPGDNMGLNVTCIEPNATDYDALQQLIHCNPDVPEHNIIALLFTTPEYEEIEEEIKYGNRTQGLKMLKEFEEKYAVKASDYGFTYE